MKDDKFSVSCHRTWQTINYESETATKQRREGCMPQQEGAARGSYHHQTRVRSVRHTHTHVELVDSFQARTMTIAERAILLIIS